VTQSLFEVQRALPGLVGLGIFAQIVDLGQVKAGQIVDQVCNVGGAGRRGTWGQAPTGEIDDFIVAVTLLLIRSIINSNYARYCAASVQPRGV